MPWSNVLGQPRVADALASAIRSGRVAHAYLFHGPEGVGKTAAALAFAQALQCERRGRPGGPEGDACGTCLACTKTARLLHPDVHLFLPFAKHSKPADKDELPPDYPERLQAIAADPYSGSDYRRLGKLGDESAAPTNKQVAHRKLPINEKVRHALAYVPSEGRKAVGILPDADLMNPPAANALLKLLEEPSPSVVLVLTTERLDGMLPTVVSRCQRVRFDRLAAPVIEGALTARGVSPTRASFVARVADGSMTRALRLVSDPTLAERRELALEFVRAAYSGRAHKLVPVADRAAKLRREPLKAWLQLLQVWIRDLVLVQAIGADAPIVNVDQAEAAQKFVAHVPHADLGAMSAAVEEATGLVEGNVSAGLVLASLGGALHEAMHGRPRPALVTPLDHT